MRRQIGAAIHALAVKVDPDSHVDDSVETLIDALDKATADLDETTESVERAAKIADQLSGNKAIPLGTYAGVEWLAVPKQQEFIISPPRPIGIPGIDLRERKEWWAAEQRARRQRVSEGDLRWSLDD